MQSNNSQSPAPTDNDENAKETPEVSTRIYAKLTDVQKERVFKSVARMQAQGLIPKK